MARCVPNPGEYRRGQVANQKYDKLKWKCKGGSFFLFVVDV
jgi:hypothetical protein